MISHFKDKVLMPESDFHAVLKERRQWQLLANELRQRLTDEHTLLLHALQQLAVERGSRDTPYFIRTWLRTQRRGRSA